MNKIYSNNGLILVNVSFSNPNGDPDNNGKPREITLLNRGEISHVSIKRKYRDLVKNKNSALMKNISNILQLDKEENKYEILEDKSRDIQSILKMTKDEFIKTYFDGRLFGSTILQKLIEENINKERKKELLDSINYFCRSGAIQIQNGISIAPIEIQTMTFTNSSGVEIGKNQGMAPDGYNVVIHGLYYIPFRINTTIAEINGCTQKDIELFLRLTPYIYSQTASTVRPNVEVIHAWYFEHKDQFGSCPYYALEEAMKPRKKGNPEESSISIHDYEIPKELPKEFNQYVTLRDLVKDYSIKNN